MSRTVSNFPAAWMGRRVTCAGHTGRLDALWNVAGHFQLELYDHTGTRVTPPLPPDTPIALEEDS